MTLLTKYLVGATFKGPQGGIWAPTLSSFLQGKTMTFISGTLQGVPEGDRKDTQGIPRILSGVSPTKYLLRAFHFARILVFQKDKDEVGDAAVEDEDEDTDEDEVEDEDGDEDEDDVAEAVIAFAAPAAAAGSAAAAAAAAYASAVAAAAAAAAAAATVTCNC